MRGGPTRRPPIVPVCTRLVGEGASLPPRGAHATHSTTHTRTHTGDGQRHRRTPVKLDRHLAHSERCAQFWRTRRPNVAYLDGRRRSQRQHQQRREPRGTRTESRVKLTGKLARARTEREENENEKPCVRFSFVAQRSEDSVQHLTVLALSVSENFFFGYSARVLFCCVLRARRSVRFESVFFSLLPLQGRSDVHQGFRAALRDYPCYLGNCRLLQLTLDLPVD